MVIVVYDNFVYESLAINNARRTTFLTVQRYTCSQKSESQIDIHFPKQLSKHQDDKENEAAGSSSLCALPCAADQIVQKKAPMSTPYKYSYAVRSFCCFKQCYTLSWRSYSMPGQRTTDQR